jgi:hypothetical protein
MGRPGPNKRKESWAVKIGTTRTAVIMTTENPEDEGRSQLSAGALVKNQKLSLISFNFLLITSVNLSIIKSRE